MMIKIIKIKYSHEPDTCDLLDIYEARDRDQ